MLFLAGLFYFKSIFPSQNILLNPGLTTIYIYIGRGGNMVFSSFEYFLCFLPITIFIYYFCLYKQYTKFLLFIIILSSLFFYGYWNPKNLYIIISSVLVNYFFSRLLLSQDSYRKTIFILSVFFNIFLIFIYKYLDFSISIVNYCFNAQLPFYHIVLPIGISFFTFQQIAYLSDCHTNKHLGSSDGFLNYCCFICFFPQLIAGPIVHHKDVIPQFYSIQNQVIRWKNIHYALLFFTIGLSKKLLIADNLSPLVAYCFDTAETLTFLEALFGSLCYTFQLYFDFSGYSDMAVGSALFFNIKLPFNFYSPYKALSIRDFWRRWHITLSIWLRDYIYIPLGGNRKGKFRTYGNLFITFLIGGIWHGAAITFVIWGILHGLALIIHRIWDARKSKSLPVFFAWLITFLFVNLAWIVFRAKELGDITKFFKALTFQHSFNFSYTFKRAIIPPDILNTEKILLILAFLFLFIFAKNSQELQNKFKTKWFTVYCAVLAILCILKLLTPENTQEFIYFQF